MYFNRSSAVLSMNSVPLSVWSFFFFLSNLEKIILINYKVTVVRWQQDKNGKEAWENIEGKSVKVTCK